MYHGVSGLPGHQKLCDVRGGKVAQVGGTKRGAVQRSDSQIRAKICRGLVGFGECDCQAMSADPGARKVPAKINCVRCRHNGIRLQSPIPSPIL